MKTWPKTRVVFASICATLACAGGTTNSGRDTAIQAIQQAPDPSAVIAAYANGVSLDRNDPGMYAAYVSRMVDLGLPEMAYRQAQTLTTLQPGNGLGWGVVGYVDARRAQMPEAVAAINLAGRLAPDNAFVQHTAGELAAWYDFKADRSKVPENIKDGLTKVRSLLDSRPAFAEAYSTARKAYETGADNASQPAPAPQASPTQGATNQIATPAPANSQVPPIRPAPITAENLSDQVAPLGYSTTPPNPVYYPVYSGPYYYPDYSGIYLDWGPCYCYGWGAGWVAPAPWWWWEPCGFWEGCTFFPFGVSFVFGDSDDFHHFHHDRFDDHERFEHGDRFERGNFAGRGRDPARWRGRAGDRHDFFGMPARPATSVSRWAGAGSQPRAPLAASAGNVNTHWWRAPSRSSSLAIASPVAGRAERSLPARESYYGHTYTAPLTPAPGAGSSATFRSLSAPRASNWVAPTYHPPAYAARRYAVPGGSLGAWRGSMALSAPRSFGGNPGGFRGGGGFGGHGGGGHR